MLSALHEIAIVWCSNKMFCSMHFFPLYWTNDGLCNHKHSIWTIREWCRSCLFCFDYISVVVVFCQYTHPNAEAIYCWIVLYSILSFCWWYAFYIFPAHKLMLQNSLFRLVYAWFFFPSRTIQKCFFFLSFKPQPIYSMCSLDWLHILELK